MNNRQIRTGRSSVSPRRSVPAGGEEYMDSKTWISIRFICLIIAGCSGWFLPIAQAVSPAPDGGYTGNNTAEGTSALFSLTSGVDNTALGFQALFHANTGRYNTATGFRALFSNTSGQQNTATGLSALLSNTTGNYNTATGVNALYRNTTGGFNTATGRNALFNNTTGANNTANGAQALYSNTTGHSNTATGDYALNSNTTGPSNTANGFQALYSNTIGAYNTANGGAALYDNTTGSANTANGHNALYDTTTGNSNTATGDLALFGNTTGSSNVATGAFALPNNTSGDGNTAVGVSALESNTTGTGNIALGSNAGHRITGNNNIAIGNDGFAGADNSIVIGNVTHTDCHIAGIYNSVLLAGESVVVASDGKLGYLPSSARFKRDIEPMGTTSTTVLALKPVTFHYKDDNTNALQFGLVAEEVAKVNPDLVVRNDKGELNTVRYEAVNAMLLNEFLKEHRKVQAEEGKVAHLEAIVQQQQEQIEALGAGLRKVTAQLETRRPMYTVANNQ